MCRFLFLFLFFTSFISRSVLTSESINELPSIYFGLDLSLGKYRETSYQQYIYGAGIYAGMPIDRFLSAECYADIHFHSVTEKTILFWKDFFEISNRHSFGVHSFRILSAGGRFNVKFFNQWNIHIGGGLGFFGFNPSINDTMYTRQTAILYEVEFGTGYHYDISKKLFIRSGIDFKIYFIENANRHEFALIFDIIGIGYKYYKELF